MTDIVERLRGGCDCPTCDGALNDAAAEIERLRGALRDYACTGTNEPCGCYNALVRDNDIRAATIEKCLDIIEKANQDGAKLWDVYVAIRALKEPVQPRADDGNSYRYHATGLPAGGDKEQP